MKFKGDVVAFVDQFDDSDEITLDDLAPLFEEPTYQIVRFFEDDRVHETVQSGVTVEEARAHCNDPTSRGEGWFDGFQEE